MRPLEKAALCTPVHIGSAEQTDKRTCQEQGEMDKSSTWSTEWTSGCTLGLGQTNPSGLGGLACQQGLVD